jgi:hypothetical protein
MHFSNKRFAAIALFLISSFAVSLVAVPAANAHDPPYKLVTNAYIWAVPNPVGVGQTVTIYTWIDQVFGVGFNPGSAALTNDYRWHNYNLTILRSDGTVAKQEIFENITDPTSSHYYLWSPEVADTYTLIFNFPGQDYADPRFSYDPNSPLVNDTYLPSMATTTLTVQDEQIAGPLTSGPLPTEYWTRPIYGQNTDWWTISSNWLGTGAAVMSEYGTGTISSFSFSTNLPWGSAMVRYPGDAVGPLTSHIMWTKQMQFGGIAGGNNFEIQGNTFFEGSAYNQRFSNPIIISGKLYYRTPISFTGSNSGPTYCVDLRTGEVLWVKDDMPSLSFGYIYDVEDANQHGVFPPILFTSNFGRAFDAFTGEELFQCSPSAPSGGISMGPQGEQLRYVITNMGNSTNPDFYLGEWNSSRLWGGQGWAPGTGTGFSPAPDTTTTTTWHWENTTTWVDGVPTITSKNVTTSTTAVNARASNRYDWNIPLPDLNTLVTSTPSIPATFYNNMLILMDGTYPARPGSFTGPGSQAPYTYIGINLNASRPGYDVGDVMWHNTLKPPDNNVTVYWAGADPTANVFVETYKETLNFIGYSMIDGSYLWGPNESQEGFDYYGQPGPAQIYGQVADGNLFSSAYGGTLYCYDITTGKIKWTYGNDGEGNSTYAGFSVPYGHYPTYINAIGNGVVYTVTTEHTILTPIYKGALVRAINETDGTELWTLNSYVGEFISMSFAMADGYATWFNGYANQIYSVGRGPSATTVTAPKIGAASGQPVVISGTVMDVSAGTQQDEQAGRFPNGVPAVSDASMKDWMGYVYQQGPFPSNCTGVPVMIDVMDSNGNYRTIGTTTSDASGTFSLTWTPDIPGNFTVIASFKGNKAYWPSYAETSFTVMNPPESTAPTPTPASNTDAYVAGFGIALLIVLVAGIVIIVLMLRRR